MYGRGLGHLLTVQIEEYYNTVTIMSAGRDGTGTITSPLRGSDTEPDKERNLASRDRVRLSSCEALSAIVGNCAINNGSTIDAFPCIEDEKEV